MCQKKTSLNSKTLFNATFQHLPPQVTASQLSPSSSHKPSILILADSDQERNKWVGLLNELHRILKKNKLKERFVYIPKEAYDSTLPLIKTTQSAAIIGEPEQTTRGFRKCQRSTKIFVPK